MCSVGSSVVVVPVMERNQVTTAPYSPPRLNYGAYASLAMVIHRYMYHWMVPMSMATESLESSLVVVLTFLRSFPLS